METENSENIDFENISEEQKQILERLNTLNNDSNEDFLQQSSLRLNFGNHQVKERIVNKQKLIPIYLGFIFISI